MQQTCTTDAGGTYWATKPWLSVLMCSCLFVSSLRSFMASALETVTALALEVEDTFRWTSIGSGIGTGLVVFLCLPAIAVFHATKKVPSFDFLFLRMGAVLSLLGTSLVHDFWCNFGGNKAAACLALLFGGDTLAFAGLLFLVGLADGIAAKHAEPRGILSMSTYTIMRSLLNNTLARGVGPPSARFAFMRLYSLLWPLRHSWPVSWASSAKHGMCSRRRSATV